MSIAREPLKVECPRCGEAIVVSLDQDGSTVTCPACDADVPVRLTDSQKQVRLDPLIGVALGGCKIIQLLGRGGMGAVYKAEQFKLRRIVALKVLAPELVGDKSYVERFMREARMVAQLEHTNVVQVHDVGEQGGYYYIIMQFIDGMSLKQLIRRKGRLSSKEAVLIMLQVCKGLDAAHKLGIVHRDIKPANILINKQGVVKISDFGLARSATGDSELTKSGGTMGTPHYMSPEHCRGEAVDIRSDIYSLGVTLFEMLTGGRPFDGDTPAAVILKHLNEPVPSLLNTDPTIPASLCALVEKMLAKSPADRYQTPAELLQALQAVRAELQGDAAPAAEKSPAGSQTSTPPLVPERAAGGTLDALRERAEKRRQQSLTMGGIAAGVLIVLVVVLLSILKGRERVVQRPPVLPPEVSSSSTTTVPQSQPQEREAAKAWDVVLQQIRNDPENYTENVRKLTTFIGQYKATAEAFKAEEVLKRIKTEWEGKAQEVVESLVLDADKAIQADDYARAFELVKQLPDSYNTEKARKSLADGRDTLIADTKKRVAGKVEALLKEDRFVEASAAIAKCTGIEALLPVVDELRSLVNRRAQDRLAAVRAEVAAAVPEFKDGERTGDKPTPRTAIVEARKKLEKLKAWKVSSIADSVEADVAKLNELESRALAREARTALEKAREDAVKADECLRKAEIDKAKTHAEAAVATLLRVPDGLDEKTAAQVKEELDRDQTLLSDVDTLREIRLLALRRAKDLIGKRIQLGAVTATISDIEPTKMTFQSEGAEFSKPIQDVSLKSLAPLSLPFMDRQKRSLAKVLLELYYGSPQQLKKAIDEAKEVGIDTTRFEAARPGGSSDK